MLALPRRVEDTSLHRALRENLRSFLETADRSGRSVPRFIERELSAYLACGIAAHGFLRLHCKDCGLDRILPFSCKGRGFCPSCGGRRMAEFAAHFTDSVIPRVPVRQWVLSLPFELRFRLAYDHRLLTAVLGVVMRAILGFQRRRARERLGVDDGRCGSITAVQRFGGALNLNVHFHVIVLDGVHESAPDGSARFHALPAPTSREVEELTAVLAGRLHALLLRRGLLDEDEPAPEWSESLATHCQAASVRGRIALGERAGREVRRIVSPVVEPVPVRATPRRSIAGLDLHVGPRIHASDRARLEKLCRYLMRPPLAQGRLKALPGNRYRYEFRRPWRDGTVAIELSGQELVEKLVALIPAPRANLVRYHGTLAPNARLRASIVPQAAATTGGKPSCPSAQGGHAQDEPGPERVARAYTWAELMRRVFERVTDCT